MGSWYVVQTKPHKEKVALENLQRQGYDAYCPLISQAKYRRKHWQQVIEPMFPRYLFVKLKPGIDDFSPVRYTLGVQRLVEFAFSPAAVDARTINQIRQQENLIFEKASTHPEWKFGDQIEIVNGPFAGLQGIFQTQSDDERVVVLLQLLGRENRVTVSVDVVAPACF